MISATVVMIASSKALKVSECMMVFTSIPFVRKVYYNNSGITNL